MSYNRIIDVEIERVKPTFSGVYAEYHPLSKLIPLLLDAQKNGASHIRIEDSEKVDVVIVKRRRQTEDERILEEETISGMREAVDWHEASGYPLKNQHTS